LCRIDRRAAVCKAHGSGPWCPRGRSLRLTKEALPSGRGPKIGTRKSIFLGRTTPSRSLQSCFECANGHVVTAREANRTGRKKKPSRSVGQWTSGRVAELWGSCRVPWRRPTGLRDWLDQFEEGNAAGGQAGEVEAVPYSAVSPSITSHRFPTRWRADKFPAAVSSAAGSSKCAMEKDAPQRRPHDAEVGCRGDPTRRALFRQQ
jgi:hypothetical protein